MRIPAKLKSYSGQREHPAPLLSDRQRGNNAALASRQLALPRAPVRVLRLKRRADWLHRQVAV